MRAQTSKLGLLLFGLLTITTLAGEVFNKYNIHFYKRTSRGKTEYFASYANFVKPLEHGMIPAGSSITIGNYRRGFTVTMKGDTKVINVEFHKVRMAMSQDDYIKLITSDKKVDYSALSKLDQEGIKKGEVNVGMTKEGVTAAYGYPAKHKTPTLESDTWTYWLDRFRMRIVTFKDGKVTAVN